MALNYLSYSYRAYKTAKKIEGDFDVIYGYQLSPVLSMIPAVKYKKRFHKPFYMYVCDLWPESLREVNGKILKKTNPVYRFFLKKSRNIYKEADLIGTKCDEFIDYLVKTCCVDRKKCYVNYEHAESNYLSVSKKPLDNGIVDFVFLGNIGIASNCDVIVEAAKFLSGNNYLIHFVGAGSSLDNIKKLVLKYGLGKTIVFHDRCSQEKVLSYYEIADVCLLTLSNLTATGLTPPAKLSSYMAAGRPIVASIDGASQRIIEESNCGFVCHSGDARSLAMIMQKIIDCPSLIQGFGMNGRDFYLNNFTLSHHVDKLIEQLESMLRNVNR